jgi:hypothetical protein
VFSDQEHQNLKSIQRQEIVKPVMRAAVIVAAVLEVLLQMATVTAEICAFEKSDII